MKVYCVITLEADGVTRSDELEFFSSRPKTPGQVGSDPGNWPAHYEVWLGNLDGGDSILLERNGFVYR